MQHFTDKALKEITAAHSEIRYKYIDLTVEIASFTVTLQNERAREFMQQGVNRRLWLLYRCVEKIFELFPPDRIERLEQDDRLDVEINLHAFLINIYGIIDNIGLAVAYENDLVGDESEQKLHPKAVNLFERRFRRLLNPQLCAYLRQDTIIQWYNKYAKNYRHALAHRIPPYVPPAALNDEQQRRFEYIEQEIKRLLDERDFEGIEALREEQESLGRSNPLFVHSFSEEATPVYLHPQLIADFGTVEELLKIAIANFHCETQNEK
ncbi:MAG: hypothetical protein U9N54_04780 [candidate division Zixibacteria bacterium]|nr:hypothetical protein [candidate division Zixibacteria bacterium]